MARAFIEIQPDVKQIGFFLHERDPLIDGTMEFLFENVSHPLCTKGRAAAHQ
jgi:hypothetical protein